MSFFCSVFAQWFNDFFMAFIFRQCDGVAASTVSGINVGVERIHTFQISAKGVASGDMILAIAVLSILVTAPLGAIGIKLSAQRLLES